MMQALEIFDIRNFIDKLIPTKEKNKYECPVCSGQNLSINPENGKYNCFNGCECKDIREALSPWEEAIKEFRESSPNAAFTPSPARSKKKSQPNPAPLPEGNLVIARLAEIPKDIPQSTKPCYLHPSVHSKLKAEGATPEELKQITVIEYPYWEGKSVLRYESPCEAKGKGRVKTFVVKREEENKTHWNKGKYAWDSYRQSEAIAAMQAINEGIPVLLWHEGEKSVERARQEKLASISAMGNASEEDLVCALNSLKAKAGREFIVAYLADNDDTGKKKAEKVSKAAARSQVPVAVIDLKRIDPNLCEKGDVVDILEAGMTGDQLAEEIIKQIQLIRDKEYLENIAKADTLSQISNNDPDITFLQQAFRTLYGYDHWICADGDLFKWGGKGYKHSPDAIERRRVTDFCNSYVLEDDDGNLSCPFAKPSKIKELFEWVKLRLEIDPAKLNPSGVNCTNGVLTVKWDDKNQKLIRELVPHDPSIHFFTYDPLVDYNPNTDATDCDRLLQCLDEPQQQVLLRNLGAAFDLEMVRKKRGREVKQLLMCGLGNNGKDALRSTVSTIFGNQGLTSCSLADFQAYDEGRKFSLSALIHSRVNWASENPQTIRLDKIQSLKLFATGNPLHSERKGKDHIEFTPKAIGLFNLNDVPPLQGAMEAIQSRIAPIKFTKTFKSNPDLDNPNELLADPRFAYDPEFIQFNVAPAFLNKMLDGLETLMLQGIDYSCTNEYFEAIQKENNHLFQFIDDLNLNYCSDSEMTAKELWNHLEQWYMSTGTLLDEDGKRTWIDQVRPSDKNVKGINQIIPRLLQIFPKAQKSSRYCPVSRRSIPTIKGIGFIAKQDEITIDEYQEELISSEPQPQVEPDPQISAREQQLELTPALESSKTIEQIDKALEENNPQISLDELPKESLYLMRINRASKMGDQYLRIAYQSLIQDSLELLNNVWEYLSDEVKERIKFINNE